MEASRIRHARVSTERVLSETRDTLRQLSGELEQTLYNVIMGEKRADEAHSKLLHIHSLSQVRGRTWRQAATCSLPMRRAACLRL